MMITQFALSSGIAWSERVSTAVTVTLQGMLMIFCVLALLWGTVELMHCLMSKKGGSKGSAPAPKPEKKEKSASKKIEKAPVGVPNERDAAIAAAIGASLAAYEDSGATVAAITAAIMAARAENGEGSSFRVVSFKRAESANRRRRF